MFYVNFREYRDFRPDFRDFRTFVHCTFRSLPLDQVDLTDGKPDAAYFPVTGTVRSRRYLVSSSGATKLDARH